MSLNPPHAQGPAALDLEIPNCDENKFQKIVFEFIERIASELSLFAADNNEFDLSANAFRQIELQIQARRIEKALQACIEKIRAIFFISQLIEYQCDHLKLYFQPKDVECIENFAKKWFESDFDAINSDFIVDLNKCLDVANQTDMKFKEKTVNSIRIVKFCKN